MKNSGLKKVDLNELLDIMTDLWNKGVDYIDITIKPEDNTLSFSFTEEYLSEEAKHALLEMEDEDIGEGNVEIKKRFTDKDINQLI